MKKKFDIYNRIFYMDVEKFVRHLCRLVLRHQMPVWNYFVNSFYSVMLSRRIIVISRMIIMLGGRIMLSGMIIMLSGIE